MKRAFFLFLDLLSVIFWAGILAVKYFTDRKLGMVRWLNYHTMKIKKTMPIGILKYVVVLLSLLIVILVLRAAFRKIKFLGILNIFMLIPMCALELIYLYYTFLQNYPDRPAYYFMLPLIGVSLLWQVLRNLIAAVTAKPKIAEPLNKKNKEE